MTGEVAAPWRATVTCRPAEWRLPDDQALAYEQQGHKAKLGRSPTMEAMLTSVSGVPGLPRATNDQPTTPTPSTAVAQPTQALKHQPNPTTTDDDDEEDDDEEALELMVFKKGCTGR